MHLCQSNTAYDLLTLTLGSCLIFYSLKWIEASLDKRKEEKLKQSAKTEYALEQTEGVFFSSIFNPCYHWSINALNPQKY